ncbi:hypothetical protein BX265_6780 [Streptomyces sp. TLI_235]|nr:hypothetical protein [Streptomyces sp. TLI_235]PBC72159.1 hypothetical protein BX265_6780 [Streptomyces sp. TLI_235]
MSGMFIPTDSATGLPTGTAAVFLTLGSALVALFKHPESAATHGDSLAFKWLCLGCKTGNGPGSTLRRTARDAANRHAATCRSIPWPTTTT